MKPFAIFISILFVSGSPFPHKFEDGFVERTMGVIVRGDTAFVEYSIGLNESTLKEVLARWDSENANRAEPIDKDVKSEIQDVDLSKQGTQSTPPTSKPHTTQTEPANNAKPSVEFSEAKVDSKVAGEGAHSIAPELLARFRKLAVIEIPKRLTVQVDGIPIAIEPAIEGPPPRHPFTMTIKFEFKLAQTKQCQLTIDDGNFLDQSGAARYSIKATGKSMLHRSNVAPILVRSERVILGKLTKTDKNAPKDISAKLSIVPSNVDRP